MKQIALLLSITSMCTGLTFTALAETSETSTETNSKTSSAEQAAEVAPTAPSRQAHIDPNTGELTSEVPPSNEQTNQPGTIVELPPIKYKTHPDGTVEGELNGHFQSNYNVSLGCDGSLHKEHSEGTPEAKNNCVEEK